MEPSLEDKGHQHSLHHIVLVVGIGDFLAPRLFDCLIQGALAHLGTERAGVVLLTLLKNYLGDVRLYNGVFHVQLPAQILDLIQI